MAFGLAFAVASASCGTNPPIQKAQGTPSSNAVSGPTSGPAALSPTPNLASHQNIQVLANGFSQLSPDSIGNSYVYYGAILKNPNATQWMAESVAVNLIFYDANGIVVASQQDSIAIILPGQLVAVGNDTQAKGVARMEVQALTQQWNETNEKLGNFAAEGVTVTLTDRYGGWHTTGSIASTFAKDLQNIRVDVIYYDNKGQIVGGGFTYLQFIPAGGKTGFEINGDSNLKTVDKGEAYVRITNLSLTG